MRKLWLDDIREPPDKTWEIARSYGAAIGALAQGNVDVISLDHDLGGLLTGCDVAEYIERCVEADNTFMPPKMYIHSANPVGRANILAAIHSIERLVNAR